MACVHITGGAAACPCSAFGLLLGAETILFRLYVAFRFYLCLCRLPLAWTMRAAGTRNWVSRYSAKSGA